MSEYEQRDLVLGGEVGRHRLLRQLFLTTEEARLVEGLLVEQSREEDLGTVAGEQRFGLGDHTRRRCRGVWTPRQAKLRPVHGGGPGTSPGRP